MRDIVGRPASAAHSEPSAKPLILPDTSAPSFLERLAGRANQLGASFDRSAAEQAVIHPAVVPGAAKPKRKRLKMPRGVLTKAARVTKKGAHAAGHELKKPGRKTALVHTIALGALFAIVLGGGVPWVNQQTAIESETSAPRRYLPNIASDPRLAPLDAPKAVAASGKKVNLYGWITPWNLGAGNIQPYSSASAFWLTVNEDGATVTPKAGWELWQQYKSQNALGETYLTVSGDPDHTYLALSDLNIQSAHIAALLAAVKEQGFDGIDIDYEALGSENKDLFTAFIRNLSTIFHQQGKKVAVTLEARLANQVPMDWQALGQIVDEVRIMAYDYHGRLTNQPGPISPLSWVAEIVAYASERIDMSKIVLALGNYGYDWVAPLSPADSWEGVGVSYDQALSLSTEYNSPAIRRTGIDERGYDVGSIPSFTYTDSQNRIHEVWFEDALSLQEKVNAATAYQIKGIMFWSVGAGDPALWKSNQ